MLPIQAWMPRFNGGAASPEIRAAMQVAYREWRGEPVVWLLRDIREVKRFDDERGVPTLAVPCPLLERISVVHVGENGQLVHPDLPVANRTPADRLLRAWLACDSPVIEHLEPEWAVTTQVPVFEGNDVYLQTITFGARSREAGAHPKAMQATLLQSQFRVFLTKDNRQLSDGSEAAYPDYQVEAAKVPVRGGQLPFRLIWAQPFQGMLPYFSNVEDLVALDAMRSLAQLAERDPLEARAAMTAESLDWVSSGVSTVQRTWFEPLMARHGAQEALMAAEEKLRLHGAMSLSDAAESPEWRRALTKPAAVIRVWGVPGLMWALLQARLEEGASLRSCKRCGTLLGRRSNGRFCRAEDNPVCYKARARERKRSQRANPSR